jgi:hypothetical protein
MNEILQIIYNIFIPYLLSLHPDQHSRKLFPMIDLIVFDRFPKVKVEWVEVAINGVKVMVQLVDIH